MEDYLYKKLGLTKKEGRIIATIIAFVPGGIPLSTIYFLSRKYLYASEEIKEEGNLERLLEKEK